MSETATDRLRRVLALVPYIANRPGVAISEIAREFEVPPAQISKDLDLLMVCGLPGYFPDDLIDVALDEDDGSVSIGFDAGMRRPVRLTSEEAIALTVALRALGDMPGLVDADAVHSALAKLEQAGAGSAQALRVAAGEPAPALGVVREAVDTGRRLWMRYYTASRDTVTERTVDPIRLVVTDGHAYLEAHCDLAGAVRHFRVDRIDAAQVLDEPAQAALWVDSDVPETMFHPDRQVPPVTLLLAPQGRWVAEYYPMAEVAEVEDSPGWLRVRMHAASDDWLVRLVLSLGGDARIEDRPDLAAAVADRSDAALAAYQR